MSQAQNLRMLVQPCDSGMCPALYADDTGKVFVQGVKLSPETREALTVSDREEVVEISPELISYLKAWSLDKIKKHAISSAFERRF